MKLSDELVEIRRNAKIEKIEFSHHGYFQKLKEDLKAHAQKGLNTFPIHIEQLPESLAMSTVEEWTELNGMEFVWESMKNRNPFQICF